MTLPDDVPHETLFWTAEGHVPEGELRKELAWEDRPDYLKLTVYFFRGDRFVKNDVYVYAKKGLFGDALAGTLGG
jgi:hypothetical protein